MFLWPVDLCSEPRLFITELSLFEAVCLIDNAQKIYRDFVLVLSSVLI